MRLQTRPLTHPAWSLVLTTIVLSFLPQNHGLVFRVAGTGLSRL